MAGPVPSARDGRDDRVDRVDAWLHRFVFGAGFMRRYPYYAAVLARMTALADPTIEVMAVSCHGPRRLGGATGTSRSAPGTHRDSRFYLHVNTEFFVERHECITGVLLHEVHHVVLGHLTHPKFRDVSYPSLMELAMEVSANEHIREALPGDPVRWQDLRECGLGADQSTMERYALLARHVRTGRDGRDGRTRRDGRAGHDGNLDRLLALLADTDGGPWTDDHHELGVRAIFARDLPANPRGADEVTRLIEAAAADTERRDGPPRGTAGLLAGKSPGELIERLTGVDSPPEQPMDWKAALQMFVGFVRTPRHTYARPNRRFPGRVGEIPGRMYYPGARERQRLLVAIDTSASMTAAELAEIARHLRLLDGLVEMTIVECDATIQRVYRFEGRLGEVAGRGGTDFRPVFEREFLAAHRPDGVIYFTDGCGPFPAEDPGVTTLWVLSKPLDFACPWGERARFARGT